MLSFVCSMSRYHHRVVRNRYYRSPVRSGPAMPIFCCLASDRETKQFSGVVEPETLNIASRPPLQNKTPYRRKLLAYRLHWKYPY